MTETLEPIFAPTHTINGIPVKRAPNWKWGEAPWVDESGASYRTGAGRKAIPLSSYDLPAATKDAQGGKFGETYGVVGEVIPSEWWVTNYRQNHSENGVMVTREAAAAALHACAWPDSSAPCGQAGNSNDDDATFSGYDEDGNCIVRLFMRGRGYFKVKLPRAVFLEVVDE